MTVFEFHQYPPHMRLRHHVQIAHVEGRHVEARGAARSVYRQMRRMGSDAFAARMATAGHLVYCGFTVTVSTRAKAVAA